MSSYRHLINHILSDGTWINGRNGSVLRAFDLTARFNRTPLVMERRCAWRLALREMEWFLNGGSNIVSLHPSVTHWWEPWTNKEGEVMHNYGVQFRNALGASGLPFDQINYLINGIKEHPNSRRLCATTWNAADMMDYETKITNCHGSWIQFYVEDDTLSLSMVQRSCDMMLGVPHNLIQYWAFLIWMAHQTDYKVGSFNWHGVDCHIYSDHIETARRVASLDHAPSPPKLLYEPSSQVFYAHDFKLDAVYEPVLNKKLEMVV